jgi:hypothetical protein
MPELRVLILAHSALFSGERSSEASIINPLNHKDTETQRQIHGGAIQFQFSAFHLSVFLFSRLCAVVSLW